MLSEHWRILSPCGSVQILRTVYRDIGQHPLLSAPSNLALDGYPSSAVEDTLSHSARLWGSSFVFDEVGLPGTFVGYGRSFAIALFFVRRPLGPGYEHMYLHHLMCAVKYLPRVRYTALWRGSAPIFRTSQACQGCRSSWPGVDMF